MFSSMTSGERGNRLDRLVGQAVAGVDFKPERMGEGGHVGQASQFRVAGIRVALVMGVAIGAGVEFDDRCAIRWAGLDLRAVGGNEDRHTAPRVAQRCNEMGQFVFLPRDLETAFGRPFLALFRHDADGVRSVAQRDGLHLGRCGHLEVERDGQDLGQPFDIPVRDVAAILAQMRGNSVGSGLLRQKRSADWVRKGGAAGVPDRGHVVDVDAESEGVHAWSPFGARP